MVHFSRYYDYFYANLLSKMIDLSGTTVSPELIAIIDKYGNDVTEMDKARIGYSVNQINKLRNNGVNDIHLYTINYGLLCEKSFFLFRFEIVL